MGGGAVTPHSSLSPSSSSSSSASSSSSIDSISNNHPSLSSASSSISPPPNTKRSGLSTDLRLGPSISTAHIHPCSSSAPSPRDQRCDWPPIKPLLRSTLTGKADNQRQATNLFVKVYMEGISIGRKLDLFAHSGYEGLVTTLSHMFKTTIFCSDPHVGGADHSGKYHILTYEDKEGDWMMVGDVPWEMFLTTVERLKITRADRC